MTLKEHFRDFPWPYYRDKMLALTTTFASIMLIIQIWDWPLTALHLQRALPFLGIIAICVAVAERKLFLVGAAVAFITTRLVIGSFLHRDPALIGLALLSMVLLAMLIRLSGSRYTKVNFPQKYTRAELLLDVTTTPIILAIIFLISRFVNKAL